MSQRTDNDAESLAARVAELERTVASLERRLAQLGGAPSAPGMQAQDGATVASRTTPDDTGAAATTAASTAPTGTAQPATTPRAPLSSPASTPYAPYPLIPDTTSRHRSTVTFGTGDDSGQWVNRLGIVLLLLGTAFGFKYSIDRGWIGPALRVGLGLGLSALLLSVSTMLRGDRRGLARMLGGGGIACAYLSIYAAFQLYALVGLGVAFAAMSAVTAVAFALAHRDDDAGMATLGAAGGLATPFLLYSGGRDVTGLVVYMGLVVTTSSAVFLSRGWRVLMSTTAFGAWAILTGLASQMHFGDQHSGEAAAVQGGILFVALATWWIAVMRELMSVEDPATWRPSRFGLGDTAGLELRVGDPAWAQQAREFGLVTPIAVLALSAWTWSVEQHAAGWIALSLAVGWAGAALHLRRLGEPGRVLSASHAAGAAVMVAFATALLLGDDARRFGLSAEALALLMAARAGDGRAARLGNLLFLVVSLEAYNEMTHAIDSITFRLGATELSELAVVAMLAAASHLAPRHREKYGAVALGGWLLWLATVLGPLPHGSALTTTAWFASAVLMLAAGLALRVATVRRGGAAAMTLTMGKLFLFDLSSVDGLWRIATFIGFGVVLLGLGYAFPTLWSGSAADDAPD